MKKSTKRFTVTTEDKNFYGFRVRTLGIDFSRFNENPVCTLNHNYEKVLGQWLDFQFTPTSISAVPAFDENDPEAMKIYDKIEQGIISTASLGLKPLDMQGEWLEKCELLEIAIAPVPGNKNANVKLYAADGQALNDNEAKTLLLSVTQNNKNPKINIKMNEKFRLALLALAVQTGLTIQLSADATDDDGVNELNKIGEHIKGLNLSVKTLTEANTGFKTKEEAAAKAEGETYVDGKIALKVITADKRDAFINLYATNKDLCKSTLDAINPVNLAIVPGAENAKKEESADRKDWDFEKWQKEDSLGLAAMQTNDVPKFEGLFNAYAANLKAKGVIA